MKKCDWCLLSITSVASCCAAGSERGWSRPDSPHLRLAKCEDVEKRNVADGEQVVDC